MAASILYTVILLVLVAGAVWRVVGREGWQKSVVFLSVWVGIFGLIFVGYSFRFELEAIGNRVAAEFDPTRAAIVGQRNVTIRGDARGHYVVRVEIAGREIPMLIDTGATNVVLTPLHAEKVGLNPSSLVYSVPMLTAGGTVYAARVNLARVAVGNIVMEDVEAYVSKIDMGESLLGMSFLGRLDSMSVTDSGLEMVGRQ